MTNASSYQRNYWYVQLVTRAGGEFCWQCGKPASLGTKLVVDRKDNSNIHSIRDSVLDDFQLLCYSCNHKKNPKGSIQNNTHSPTSRPPSREKADRGMYEPTYHANLKRKLLDEEHLCLRQVEMAAPTLSNGGSIPTCKRYFESHIKTEVNDKGIYHTFPYECDSPYCNGVHVCLAGTVPKKLLVLERKKLEQEWAAFNAKHRVLSPTPVDEYVHAHSSLLSLAWD